MCGITGYIDFSKTSGPEVLQAMTMSLLHRGPDGQGEFFRALEEANVGLGHTRLSIIDVSTSGDQPMSFEHLHIVFNGEIYNYQEVKEVLFKEGYSFHSTSDTEVLIKAFHRWGMACLDRFIGMFAFALLDEKARKVYITRDRAGVKPIHYYYKNGCLLFGSELKPFHAHPKFEKKLNREVVPLFIQYGYVPSPHAIFQDAYKLKPGHYLEIDLNKQQFQEEKYWDSDDFYKLPTLDISYEEAKKSLKELLISAFNYRMVADVPVGVFLSGGFDSSAVASLLQKHSGSRIKTFTIGFQESEFNEAIHAKKVADYLGTEHTEYYCSSKEAMDIIPDLPFIFDEPFGDNSSIPTVLVSKLARKSVKVALSADGGDEIFAGYPKHEMAIKYTQMMPQLMLKAMSSSMGLFKPEMFDVFFKGFNTKTRYQKIKEIWKNPDPAFAMKVISQFIPDQEMGKYAKHFNPNLTTNFDLSGTGSSTPLNQLLAIDFKTFLLDNNLNKVDRATMAVGLEGREPLLDHRIVEFAAQLPDSFKRQGENGKRILKDIVYDYVPREIMERPKMGFIAPIEHWFRSDLKELLFSYLNEEKLQSSSVFHAQGVLNIRDDFYAGSNDKFQRLWHFLAFQMWAEKWKVE